jgi:hypothetical protein
VYSACGIVLLLLLIPIPALVVANDRDSADGIEGTDCDGVMRAVVEEKLPFDFRLFPFLTFRFCFGEPLGEASPSGGVVHR